MTLGQKLRFYRTAEGYRQREIADMLSISRSTYSYYEEDKVLPSVHMLLRLAQIFKVGMEFLADDGTEPFGSEDFLLIDAKKRVRKKK